MSFTDFDAADLAREGAGLPEAAALPSGAALPSVATLPSGAVLPVVPTAEVLPAEAALSARAATVDRYSEADVPTEYGTLRVIVYREVDAAGSWNGGVEHLAIVKGDVAGRDDLHVRTHSECLTGEVLHSLKCDCREQLDFALRHIGDEDAGAVLYLRQEGRGIGLGNKIKAYALQQEGADTVDANRMLGFDDDLRTYHVASDMLRDLEVRSVVLLTNNPAKVDALRRDGVNVSGRLPVHIAPNEHSRDYLLTKRARMGHILSNLGDLLDAE